MTDWQNIVDRHSSMVWRTVYRLLDNYADAADSFKETFVSALELSGRERVRNWSGLLRRLATARALDRLRARYRQSAKNIQLSDGDIYVSGNPGPMQTAQVGELAEQLRGGLAQLPDDQAQVFCLRFLEDQSYRQIARQMNIKTNAVGVLLHRARGRLRELLSEYAVEGKK